MLLHLLFRYWYYISLWAELCRIFNIGGPFGNVLLEFWTSITLMISPLLILVWYLSCQIGDVFLEIKKHTNIFYLQGQTTVQGEGSCLDFDGLCLQPTDDQVEAGTTCGGDSGSSVGVYRDGNFEIDGVVSFGETSCRTFSGHTPIVYFVKWILDNSDGSSWE